MRIAKRFIRRTRSVAVPNPWVVPSPELLAALEQAVLIEDTEVALSRVDDLETALELRLRTMLGVRRLRPRLRAVDARLPEGLAALLDSEAARSPDSVRLVESLQDIVDEWQQLFLRKENLVGHLIIAHRQGAEIASRSHDSLLRLHSDLHDVKN